MAGNDLRNRSRWWWCARSRVRVVIDRSRSNRTESDRTESNRIESNRNESKRIESIFRWPVRRAARRHRPAAGDGAPRGSAAACSCPRRSARATHTCSAERDETRRDETRRDETRRDEARRGEAWQGKGRRGKARGGGSGRAERACWSRTEPNSQRIRRTAAPGMSAPAEVGAAARRTPAAVRLSSRARASVHFVRFRNSWYRS